MRLYGMAGCYAESLEQGSTNSLTCYETLIQQLIQAVLSRVEMGSTPSYSERLAATLRATVLVRAERPAAEMERTVRAAAR
eukprot:gene5961-7411_t